MAFILDNVLQLLMYQQRPQKTQDRRFVMPNGPKLAPVANACRNINLNLVRLSEAQNRLADCHIFGNSLLYTSLFTKQVAKLTKQTSTVIKINNENLTMRELN